MFLFIYFFNEILIFLSLTHYQVDVKIFFIFNKNRRVNVLFFLFVFFNTMFFSRHISLDFLMFFFCLLFFIYLLRTRNNFANDDDAVRMSINNWILKMEKSPVSPSKYLWLGVVKIAMKTKTLGYVNRTPEKFLWFHMLILRAFRYSTRKAYETESKGENVSGFWCIEHAPLRFIKNAIPGFLVGWGRGVF